jgi:hypothetical protein
MSVASHKQPASSFWLLLVFTLPTAKASERVGVWRKLQRYGAIALPASGYVLPNSPVNQERFEWLATSIRSSKGQAAVAQVSSFADLRNDQIEQMFKQARTREYQSLEKELKKVAHTKKRGTGAASLLRLKKRLEQIIEVDFFESPVRVRIEQAVRHMESKGSAMAARIEKKNPKDYVGKTWITRPKPGIDRVSSAWLIVRHIDAKAKFAFAADPGRHPDAIPFDMFNAGGFGHVENDCTFETLMKSFGIRDAGLKLVAEAVHDADFADEHFARTEALGIDRILDGWNKQQISNEEVLRRGMEMIEGLYNGIR